MASRPSPYHTSKRRPLRRDDHQLEMSEPLTRLTPRALNRALLARQGLLAPLESPPVEAVESIGALQAQHWPAVPVALWSRLRGLRKSSTRPSPGARLVVGKLR